MNNKLKGKSNKKLNERFNKKSELQMLQTKPLQRLSKTEVFGTSEKINFFKRFERNSQHAFHLAGLNKKSELQIMETIMVVIILIVIIIAGMAFFYKYMLGSIDADNKAYKADLFSKGIYTFPQQAEITCYSNKVKESCIDAYKMIGFSDIVARNKDSYIPTYGFQNITVEIVYPLPKERVLCSKARSADCSTFVLYENIPGNEDMLKQRRVLTTPISVYFPGERKYAIGVLTITGYGIGN